MKKIVALVLTLVMCFAMTTTVFADMADEAWTVIDGQKVQLNLVYADGTQGNDAQRLFVASCRDFENSCGDDDERFAYYHDIVQQITGKDVVILSKPQIIDVSLPAGITVPEGGLEVTFELPMLDVRKDFIMLHMKEDGSWEEISGTRNNMEQIVTRFTSFSPVLYMTVEDNPAAPAAPAGGHTHTYYDVVVAPTETTEGYTLHICDCGDSFQTDFVAATGVAADNGTASTAATSPQTGESEMPAIILSIAATCGCVMIFTEKKFKKAKAK